MLRWNSAAASSAAPWRYHWTRRRAGLVSGGLGAIFFAAMLSIASSPAGAAGSCDRSATPSTFASQVTAAAAGQTICLASGGYGTWAGTNKAITVRADMGASPSMRISFGAGDSAFRLEGMTGMGGTITNGASDITIKDSAFSAPINLSGANTDGIVLEHNTHNWPADSNQTNDNAKIYLQNSLTGSLERPAVTIRDSEIKNGDLDGIHLGGGSGYQILANALVNLCESGPNHTDNIQFDTSSTSQVRIAGNYLYAAQSCGTQGITSYDAGTNGVIIEDNVVDIPRDWGIELYADHNSIVRHNTVVYHDKAYSMFNTTTGQIDIDHKTSDPPSTGTQVTDNITTKVNFDGGSTGTANNNLSGEHAIYIGPLNTYAGYQLAPTSPIGRIAATDGLNAGIRPTTITTPTTPTSTPTPTGTPTATATGTATPRAPAVAVWSAPASAKVGSAVVLDGTASTGEGTITCTWTFEDVIGSALWEPPITGCVLSKTFRAVGVKYVKLAVKDADGATNANKQSFIVAAAATPADTTPPETSVLSGQ